MVVTNKVAYIGGAALTIIAAVITYLHTQGVLGTAWTTGIVAVLPFAAVFGIQALSPSAIAQKIPAQIAAAIGTGLSGINVMIVTLHVPGWVQIVVGALDTGAGALGIAVTGVAVSKAAKAYLGRHPAAVNDTWELNALAVSRLVMVPLSPLFVLLEWVMRNIFGVKGAG